jgi:hypothetical protein
MELISFKGRTVVGRNEENNCKIHHALFNVSSLIRNLHSRVILAMCKFLLFDFKDKTESDVRTVIQYHN